MNREQAIPYVSYVVDDAGCGRSIGDDMHAIVRHGSPSKNAPHDDSFYPSVLVGWQCGFEPLFVAVHSYLDVKLDEDEAEEMAADYLEEKGWFGGERKEADYIIR